jgi:hypothetical protein
MLSGFWVVDVLYRLELIPVRALPWIKCPGLIAWC